MNACRPTVGTSYSRFWHSAKMHWKPNPFGSGGIRVKLVKLSKIPIFVVNGTDNVSYEILQRFVLVVFICGQ